MSGGTVVFFVFFFLFFGALFVYLDRTGQRYLNKKIDREPISRDYHNIPGLCKCMRCGNDAYITTTVELPAVETKTGKLNYNKFDTRIFYSVRCTNCSLGTAQCEDIAAVLREWNESDFKRISDKEDKRIN